MVFYYFEDEDSEVAGDIDDSIVHVCAAPRSADAWVHARTVAISS